MQHGDSPREEGVSCSESLLGGIGGGECPGNDGNVGLGVPELESVVAGDHYKLLVKNMTSWCTLGR